MQINLNLITIKGSPLHQAAKEGNKQILMMLLQKDVDIHLKDNNGKIALEICNDEECMNILKKYEDKK
jgi:ankyrin repeat protein